MRRLLAAVAALLVVACATRAEATVTVHTGNSFVFVGVSITNFDWYNPPGGLLYQINQPLKKSGQVTFGVGNVMATDAGHHATKIGYGNVVNSGVNGDVISALVGNVDTRITNYNPDIIVLLIGVNNVSAGTTLNAFTTSYDTVLSQIRAWSSTVQIALVSIMCKGELYTTPPPAWANGADDATIAAFNGAIQALAVTYNATYINIRDPLLAWEVAYDPNPPVAQNSFTYDGIHPRRTYSDIFMGQWAIYGFVAVP